LAENKSESTREIPSVNNYLEATEKVLHCYISTLSTASHCCLQSFYVHNGLRIYQTKYCKITFLALLRLAYLY